MKKSEVVKALADVASQGTYQVQPKQARQMNAIFELAAQVINELEEEERQEETITQLAEEALAETFEEEDNDTE